MALKHVAALALATALVCPVTVVRAQGMPTATAESVGMSAARLERIAGVFKEHIDKGNLPGVVVMVARKGKLVYSETLGFQDKAAGKPLREDAVFR
ncbi:MAG TPA: serine hydrolase, partial [Burkholderiales bacterium]|nr:serine hydrolase [Burkholderiales bacterium]